MKTLHPGVHGGILARRDLPEHLDAIRAHGIAPIDVVVVNLYPFRATVTAPTSPTFDVAVENIDIGARPTSARPRAQGFVLGHMIGVQGVALRRPWRHRRPCASGLAGMNLGFTVRVQGV